MQPVPRCVLRGHTAAISALAFSPRATRLFSADAAGCMMVWDLRSNRAVGQAVHVTRTGEGVVGLFAANEDVVVTYGRDDRMKAWTVNGAADAKATFVACGELGVNGVTLCRPDFLRLPGGAEAWVAAPARGKLSSVAIYTCLIAGDSQIEFGSGIKEMPAATAESGTLMSVRWSTSAGAVASDKTAAPSAYLLACGYENGSVEIISVNHATREGAPAMAFQRVRILMAACAEAVFSVLLVQIDEQHHLVCASGPTDVVSYRCLRLALEAHQNDDLTWSKLPMPCNSVSDLAFIPTRWANGTCEGARSLGAVVMACKDGSIRMASATLAGKTGSDDAMPLAVTLDPSVTWEYHTKSVQVLAVAPLVSNREEPAAMGDADAAVTLPVGSTVAMWRRLGATVPVVLVAAGGQDTRVSVWNTAIDE